MIKLIRDFQTKFEQYFTSNKGREVSYYMHILDSNPNLNFQMDFFRGEILDLQICRQSLIKDQNTFNIINENDYASELCFTLNDEKSSKALKRFKESHLFNNAILSYELEKHNYFRYIIFLDSNNLNLFNHIKYVLEEIYIYDKTVKYHINFHKFI